jgi:hypothetical protein
LVCFFFFVRPHFAYSFTDEAHRAKENAKLEATQRAEQRKKKKAVEQVRAAQRERARSKNKEDDVIGRDPGVSVKSY